MYGVKVSPDLISRVTDAVLEEVRDWQNRPLDPVYPVIFFDALRVKIRDEGLVRNKAVYVALALTGEGEKEVLGLRIEQTEGAKFWLKVMNDLKTRGVNDVPIAVVDGLKSLMGWMAPEWHLCAKLGMQLQRRGPSMTQVTTIGLDLAKRVFQVHGVDAAGAVVLRRQLKRRQMVPFFTKLPSCLIGMEACGTAHHWGRTLRALGHEVRLIPPAYAKAYVRRNKTDPADAEAICEAVSRPSMRFVPIKSEADQAMAAVHRVRERLIAQRTQTINILRGQMAEFGVVAAKGPQHVKGLVAELVEPESVPEPLRQVLLGLVRTPDGAAGADRGAGQTDPGLASGQPVQPPAERDRRLWPDPLERSGAAGARAAALRLWPRPVGLDRPGPQAELLGRQDPAGSDQQEGRCLSAPAADQRRPGGAQQQTGQGRPLDRAAAAD